MVRLAMLRILESYFRHRWLYLVPMVVALAAGAAYVAKAPPKYFAAGRLYVEKDSLLQSLTSTSTDGNWWVTPSQSTTNEINALLATRAFVRSAIQKTDLEANMSGEPEAVDKAFTTFQEAVQVAPNGDKLVEVSAKSDDPKLAYQMTIATMEAYVQWKINSDYQESTTAKTFFENLMKPYKDDVDKTRAELVAYLDAHPTPVRGDRPPQEQLEVDRLQAAVTRAEERFNTAQNNEESARLAMAKSESVTRQTYMILDQPEMPREAKLTMKGIAQDMILFFAVGVVLSVAGILWGALLDRTLRLPIDVRNSLHLPVLAMIPDGRHVPQLPVTAPVDQTAPFTESTPQADQAAVPV
jgi:capsular polysaccharide biosynthesis protein